jgi:hypothetical protein
LNFTDSLFKKSYKKKIFFKLTSLMTALANNGFAVTNELNTIGNLACGFSAAQVSSLTNSTIV